jgi:hypothetical protein
MPVLDIATLACPVKGGVALCDESVTVVCDESQHHAGCDVYSVALGGCTIYIIIAQASADAHARSVSSCIVLLPGQPAASSGGQGSLSEAPGQPLCATVRLGDLQRVEPEEGGAGLARTLRLTAVVVADVSAVTGACLSALHIGGIGRGLSAGLCLLARRGVSARTHSAVIQRLIGML